MQVVDVLIISSQCNRHFLFIWKACIQETSRAKEETVMESSVGCDMMRFRFFAGLSPYLGVQLEQCILLKVIFLVVVQKTWRFCELWSSHDSDFSDVTPCSLVDSYQYFGGLCCIHLHPTALKMETAGSSITLVTTGNNLPIAYKLYVPSVCHHCRLQWWYQTSL
jgi:hypothetical protein